MLPSVKSTIIQALLHALAFGDGVNCVSCHIDHSRTAVIQLRFITQLHYLPTDLLANGLGLFPALDKLLFPVLLVVHVLVFAGFLRLQTPM